MNSRSGLNDSDIQRLCAVFQKHPEISRVLLYGSRALGTFKPGSDIDIVIVGDVSEKKLSHLANELDDLLLPYLIDIAIYDRIQNPELKSHIDRVGLPLFERS
jgi:predicted nucleotidyltransferase